MTVLDRFILVIAVGILHIVISFFTFSLWIFSKLIQAIGAAMTSGLAAELMGEKTASKGGFPIGFMDFTSGVFITFEVILTLTVWAFFIFFILDLIFDFIITRRDLRELRAKENVILSGKIQKSSLRVLVVTTTKERLKNLMRITQSVDSANFFWFTTFKEAGPDSILTEPIWTVINIEDNRVEKLL